MPKKTPRKRDRGRPPDTGFKPNDVQRQMVELGTGLGIPQHDMVTAILSPTSGKPISEVTLRKHFKDEIRTGIVKFKMKVGVNLLKLSERNASAAIFLGKVRLGMKETIKLEHSGKVEGGPILTESQIDAKIDQLLTKAEDRAQRNKQAASKKPKPGGKARAR